MTGAEGWLALFRRACDEVGARVAEMDSAQRRQPVGRGAGGDLTMVVDQVAEDIVIEVLTGSGRSMRLVSEEIGERQIGGPGGPVVVVDPIDGSLNAKRGLPVFATSIALAEGPTMGDVTLGVVRDHGSGEEWIAERGRGAHVDGRPLTPFDHDETGIDLLLVEGAYPSRIGAAAAALDGRVGRFRALGSLALSLCHAGAGRCDAMVGLGPGRSIDVAAAQLVAREAGVLVGLPRVGDLASTPLDLGARFHVVAGRDAATMDLLAELLEGPVSPGGRAARGASG